MLQFKFYKYFLCTISVFGLAPFSKEKWKRGKFRTRALTKSLFYQIVPVCGVLLNLSQFSLLLKIVDGTMDGLIHVILFYGYFVLVVSSNIAGNIQCLVKRSTYVDIICQIHQVECLFMIKFSKTINYRTSNSKFKVKVCIIFALLICATLTSYTINGWQLSESILLRTVVTILEIISSLVCLHPVLYIDIIAMFVLEMSDTVRTPKNIFPASVDIFEKFENLKKLKSIHFELWNLVKKINSFFGWNLLFLLTKFFIDITYNLYWIFIEFQNIGWKSWTHMGMMVFIVNIVIINTLLQNQ